MTRHHVPGQVALLSHLFFFTMKTDTDAFWTKSALHYVYEQVAKCDEYTKKTIRAKVQNAGLQYISNPTQQSYRNVSLGHKCSFLSSPYVL